MNPDSVNTSMYQERYRDAIPVFPLSTAGSAAKADAPCGKNPHAWLAVFFVFG
jgi:hypothetical protein